MGKRIVFLFVGLVLVLGLIILLRVLLSSEKHENCLPGPYIVIEQKSVELGDSMDFQSDYLKVGTFVWNFGDNSPSDSSQNPSHLFSQIGKYMVSLAINGQCKDSVEIFVVESKAVVRERDSIVPVITGPSTGFVREGLTFTGEHATSKKLTWKFGEMGAIDKEGSPVTYSFTDQGDWDIQLTGDSTDNTGIHRIKIVNRPLPKGVAAPKTPQISEIEMQSKLNSVVGKSVPEWIKIRASLLPFLCGNKSVPVIFNRSNGKQFSFWDVFGDIRTRELKIGKISFKKNSESCIEKITFLEN